MRHKYFLYLYVVKSTMLVVFVTVCRTPWVKGVFILQYFLFKVKDFLGPQFSFK